MSSIVFLVLVAVSFGISLFLSLIGFFETFQSGEVLGILLSSTLIFSVFFLVFALFINKQGVTTYRELAQHYNIKRPTVSGSLVITLLGLVYLVTFIMAQTGVIDFFKVLGYEGSMVDININGFHEYLMLVFAIAVLPAIVEELLFRGLILHGFMKYGKVAAVIASSVLFSLMHLSPSQTFAQFALGIICAVVYLGTKNIVYPILLHFVNNFTIVTILYIDQGRIDDTFTYNFTNVMTMLVLLAVGIFIIWGLIKVVIKNQDWNKEIGQRRNFFSKENGIFAGAVAVGMFIWLMVFLI